MRILLVYLILCLSFYSKGQLQTSTSQTPTGLVQNVLLGPGVSVSNISYTGSSTAIGSFTATGTNLGISNGIVMTTGTVINNNNGPHGPNNSGSSGFNNNQGGYSQLSNLIGGTQTFNAAILEFDFIPYSDTVRFKYVFGSEEYPEYVGSDFNDVFAFFISGPGISGLQNIAKLPNGTPVTINNINAGSNASFFVNNGNGSQSPFNSSAQYIQYDGFTKVLEAVSRVECGETYHLVIAIADAQDGILDSGIFLEANSLTSITPVEIASTLSFQAFPGQSNVMAEGCVTTTVTLKRNGNTSNALTIPINVSGTAIEGTDYTNIPNTITFPPGQSQVSFTFDALSDAIIEGLETIILSFPISDPCGNITPIVLDLGINDVEDVNVTVQSSDVLCPGDPLELIAVATGGVGPYVYSWNTGDNTSSIFVSPTSTSVYTVSVTDNCLNQTATGSGTVNVPVYPPLVLDETDDITEICPYIPTTLESNASGGAGNFSYQWSSSMPETLGILPTQEVLPSTTTTYTVLVTDQCGVTETANIVYTITSPPLLTSMSPNIEICPGDSTNIFVNSSGGYGQHYYNWLHSGETTSSVWVQPIVSTNYIVSVSDECQTFSVEDTTRVIVVKPQADFVVSSTTLFNNLPITFQNLSTNAVDYQWSFGDGNSSTLVHPNNTYIDPGHYIIQLIAIDNKGCLDSITHPIFIEEEYYVYVPNTFTPDGNRFNNEFSASTFGIKSLEVNIYNRWGQNVFNSKDKNFRWDGTYKNLVSPDGVYTYKMIYFTNSGREFTITGHVCLIK
jgi:gliding motility-associated-like protein